MMFSNNQNKSKNQQLAREIFEQVKKSDERTQRAYGCIIGAFIGDALGSYHEFSHNVDQQLLNMVMAQPGGGTYNLLPGQLTDDSELALSQAYGLIESPEKYDKFVLIFTYDPNCIAKHYTVWLNSQPFDIGNTMGNAMNRHYQKFNLSRDTPADRLQEVQLAKSMAYQSGQFNRNSQSNGCLMKITPLVLYCTNLKTDQEIEYVVTQDIQLTHPQKIMHQACSAYTIACVELINSGDAQKAIERVENYLGQGHIDKDLSGEWWNLAKKSETMKCTQNIGWAKIAWSHSFYHLLNYQNYQKDETFYASIHENVMRQVLGEGGDTDTNGAIVGGILGAIIGINRLKPYYIENLLKCNTENGAHPRPSFLEPHNAFIVADQILKIAPASIQSQ